MEIEQRQAQLIEYFVKQASTVNGSSLVNLIVEATSHPSLFAFSEILSVPNLLQQLQGTESSSYIDLLRLFAHGIWTDYKSNAVLVPQLVPEQAVKLKQLSVLTLAETNKVLSYDQLLKELEVDNVRELEDFLINECMYVGIVKGKLNQLRRCFEVQFAAGRDLRHGQLENMMQSLKDWALQTSLSHVGEFLANQLACYIFAKLATSDNLLSTIQEKIKWAEAMGEWDKNQKKEVKNRLQDAKQALNFKAGNQLQMHADPFSFEWVGEIDCEEDLIRSKRKRSPKNYI